MAKRTPSGAGGVDDAAEKTDAPATATQQPDESAKKASGKKKKFNFTLLPGELWPRTPHGTAVNIEVVGFTGEFWEGKTWAMLDLAPGKHPEGHKFAGLARTRYYDGEKSGGNYSGFGHDRVDIFEEVSKAFTDPRTGEIKKYDQHDVFRWLLADLQKIPAGRYDVIGIDPITDIEDAITSLVRSKPEQFGLTSNQVNKSGGMLWGAMKTYYKQTLLQAMSGRCKTFAFTAHMRDEYIGNAPSGKREPKGKETLYELSTLYLQLERKIPTSGPDAGKKPEKPAAIVLKGRIDDVWIDEDGEVCSQNLIPPRIDPYTANHLRQYIAHGFNVSRPLETEKVIVTGPTEADLLRLRQSVADAETQSATSRLDLLRRQAELRSLAESGEKTQVDPQAQLMADRAAKKAASVVADRVAEEERKAIEEVEKQEESAKTTPSPAATSAAAPAAVPAATTEDAKKPSFDKSDWNSEEPVAGGGGCTKGQMMKARDYSSAIWPDTKERAKNVAALIAKAGKEKPQQLDKAQAEKLVAFLEKKLPPDYVPF